MSTKKIKIPKGEFTLMFERDNLCSTITDEMLLQFINDGVAKMANAEQKEKKVINPLTYEESYDDENPDYIKQSQEEI